MCKSVYTAVCTICSNLKSRYPSSNHTASAYFTRRSMKRQSPRSCQKPERATIFLPLPHSLTLYIEFQHLPTMPQLRLGFELDSETARLHRSNGSITLPAHRVHLLQGKRPNTKTGAVVGSTDKHMAHEILEVRSRTLDLRYIVHPLIRPSHYVLNFQQGQTLIHVEFWWFCHSRLSVIDTKCIANATFRVFISFGTDLHA